MCVLLTSCQTYDHTQYHVPANYVTTLLPALIATAEKHGLQDMTEQSDIPDTLLYYSTGDASFTALGARHIGDMIVIDIFFRSAGLGRKKFRAIAKELDSALSKMYGKALIRVSPNQYIPIRKEAEHVPAGDAVPLRGPRP